MGVVVLIVMGVMVHVMVHGEDGGSLLTMQSAYIFRFGHKKLL